MLRVQAVTARYERLPVTSEADCVACEKAGGECLTASYANVFQGGLQQQKELRAEGFEDMCDHVGMLRRCSKHKKEING